MRDPDKRLWRIRGHEYIDGSGARKGIKAAARAGTVRRYGIEPSTYLIVPGDRGRATTTARS